MHVERFRRAEPVLVPDGFHDVLPGERRAGFLGEEGKQVVLLRRQRQFGTVEVNAPGAPVDHDPATGIAVRLRLLPAFLDGFRWPDPPQHGSHPRDHLADAERFRHVVVRADFEPHHAVDLVGACADHDDRHVAPRPQLTADVQAVGVRQAEVQQHQPRRVGGQRLGPGADPVHLVAVPAQAPTQRLGDRLIILDQ
jgi:hypothetical protein